MNNAFFILMLVAMGLVVCSLAIGVFFMARGGESNKKYANKLMQARVILQGVALVLFVLAVLSRS